MDHSGWTSEGDCRSIQVLWPPPGGIRSSPVGIRRVTTRSVRLGFLRASLGAGAATAASRRSCARTAGHSRCSRSRGSAGAVRRRRIVHRSQDKPCESPRRWVHRQRTLFERDRANRRTTITIEREEPHRRAFRRDAGGMGSSWEFRLVLKHSPTVSNERRSRLETPRELCRTVRTNSAAASS